MADSLKDQRMLRIQLFMLALAGFVCFDSSASATPLTQDFANDPAAQGWRVFGNTNLFTWNAADGNLRVTWDSAQPNSFFYHPLGTIVTRQDDFSFSFDLRLMDIASGTEPGKTGGMEIGIGLMNVETSTSTNFARASYGGAGNLVELDYFPAGYFEGYGDVPATLTPSFVSSSGYGFAPVYYTAYELELPTGETIHVDLSYAASNQTMTATLTTNGVALGPVPDVVLDDSQNSSFGSTNDFAVNAFSISSYHGDDYDSVLAHGEVDNLVITIPPPPIQNIAGGFTNGIWEVQFSGLTNWVYTLERTTDFRSWNPASSVTPGREKVRLVDSNPTSGASFYRIRADRP